MRVLYLTNIPAPYRVDFFNELGKLCRLTALYERKLAENRDGRWLEENRQSYESLCLNGIKSGADSGFNPGVIRFLSRKKYDVIVAGGYSTPTGMTAILWMALNKIPFILSADGGVIGEDSALKRGVKRFFISRASAWLSSGEATDKYLEHYGANPEKIMRYPMTSVRARDVEKNPATDAEKLRLKQLLGIAEKKLVVTAGQFIRRKGFDTLIEAAAKLGDDTGVYIIGGEPTDEYMALIERHGAKNVRFVGFSHSGTLKKYFRAADVFVLPTRYDIWGLVINEAMACGLPVITTDKCVAGLELVKNGSGGYIIPPEDPAALASKISQLLSDPGLMLEMGQNNLEVISKYTVENMALSHMRIFSEFSARHGLNDRAGP